MTESYRTRKENEKLEAQLQQALTDANFEHIVEPFELGEVSFHYGWTFHHAGANLTDKARRVMTIIYMEEDMRLKPPSNENQQNDSDTWCPGAKVGDAIATDLNPVIYSNR